MEQIDWTGLARLVPEVIIVLIFVWFSLKRDERAEAARTQREGLRLAREDKRDKDWREFLVEERTNRADAAKTTADELKLLTGVVTTTNALLVAHDTSMKVLAAEALARQKAEDILRGAKEGN